MVNKAVLYNHISNSPPLKTCQNCAFHSSFIFQTVFQFSGMIVQEVIKRATNLILTFPRTGWNVSAMDFFFILPFIFWKPFDVPHYLFHKNVLRKTIRCFLGMFVNNRFIFYDKVNESCLFNLFHIVLFFFSSFYLQYRLFISFLRNIT